MKSQFHYTAERWLWDNHPDIPVAVRDQITDGLTDLLIDEFEKDGQRYRWPAFDEAGNPRCSWCGGLGFTDGTETPLMTPRNPAYGIFCTCTEKLAEPRQAAAT